MVLPLLEEASPLPFNFTVHVGEEAGLEWLEGAMVWENDHIAVEKGEGTTLGRSSPATPPRWDSTTCMASWGVPELQTKADPNGYLLFSEGREQLGNNRFLFSDGLVIARALNRTLVEYPMQNSRIATPDAALGSCDYWDCENLCSYHRILDIWAFRSMLRESVVLVADFLTVISADKEQMLLPSLVTAENITGFFEDYNEWQVIAMKMAWKSGLRRAPMDILRPNPFYLGLVGRLLEKQEEWRGGRYMAVQWRTETSTGNNLTRCYETHVRPSVEQRRAALGYGARQVFFNTDLVGQASTTYNASVSPHVRMIVKQLPLSDRRLSRINAFMVLYCSRVWIGAVFVLSCRPVGSLCGVGKNPSRRHNAVSSPAQVVYANRGVVARIRVDYPASMENAVYDVLENEEDAGVKAMISGMVSASAGFLLSSSFNGSGSDECQKPHSKYIDLVAEWRLQVLGKNLSSIGRMLPGLAVAEDEESCTWLFWCVLAILSVLLALVLALASICCPLSEVGGTESHPSKKRT
ncbi:unnamed protein product [Scytosiphon promiscuus]